MIFTTPIVHLHRSFISLYIGCAEQIPPHRSDYGREQLAHPHHPSRVARPISAPASRSIITDWRYNGT